MPSATVALVSCASSGETSSETQPSTPAVRWWTRRNISAARSDPRSPARRTAPRPSYRRRPGADLVIIGVAMGDRVIEDRGIGGEAGHRQFVDVPRSVPLFSRSRVMSSSHEALAELMELFCRLHLPPPVIASTSHSQRSRVRPDPRGAPCRPDRNNISSCVMEMSPWRRSGCATTRQVVLSRTVDPGRSNAPVSCSRMEKTIHRPASKVSEVRSTTCSPSTLGVVVASVTFCQQTGPQWTGAERRGSMPTMALALPVQVGHPSGFVRTLMAALNSIRDFALAAQTGD